MTQPLQLFDLPPVTQLTDRQQTALTAIRAAGWDGLHTDEVGACVHAWQGRHPADERCEWCGSVGRELGTSLRDKELVKQRRVKAPGGDHFMVWVAVGAKPVRVVAPFEWPVGF